MATHIASMNNPVKIIDSGDETRELLNIAKRKTIILTSIGFLCVSTSFWISTATGV
jgi:hypothetical protein